MPRLQPLPFRAHALSLSLLLGAIGCGAGLNAASNNDFSVQSASDHITTAGKLQFTAREFSGGAALVQWSSSGGDDEAGPGTVDANGLYTPPAYLRASAVRVQITAALSSDLTVRATENITVTPAISIAPQNVALTPGAQTRLYASIAEVGSGAVRWSDGSDAGRFSGSHCQVSRDTFTQCSVVYTAPSAAGPAQDVPLRATLRTQPDTQATTRLLLNSTAVTTPLTNQFPQTGADALGTSGGNAHDSANQYCCGGTLGAMVNIAGVPYVLSNNHVLARTDQAAAGESILQPGLLDTDCGYAPSYTVATLSYAPRLQDPATNVDAAVAQAATGALDAGGAILGFGATSSGTLANAPPARDAEDILQAGARIPTVVKSGRTTGLTCSAISQIAVDFNVHYNTACDGSGDAFTKLFTNQIAITGAAFADSGDSGALLADQQTAQPVGLLFAGNATETFANPVEDVLRSLSSFAAEKNPSAATVEIVGGDHHAVTCLDYRDAASPIPAIPVLPAQMADAEEIATRLRRSPLASNLRILEVAAGASNDAPGEPAIVLTVDDTQSLQSLPATLGGLRTVIDRDTPAEAAAGQHHVRAVDNDLSTVSRALVDQAIAIKQRYSASLRADPAIFGVGVGKSFDNPAEAAIVIFIDKNQTPRTLPQMLGGVRVQYLYQDEPRAFDWKQTANASQLRPTRRVGISCRRNFLNRPDRLSASPGIRPRPREQVP